jgi:two-component system OmpR family sensor kinase
MKHNDASSAMAPTTDARRHVSHSLRRRLLWLVLLAIVLVTLLQAITAYRGALRQADALFDEHLQQMARSMRNGVPPGLSSEAFDADQGLELYVQIWGQDGTQIFRSSKAAFPSSTVLGFSDVEALGNHYRVYSLQTGLQTIQIAQDLDGRTARARAIATRAIVPFVLLTPLLILAVWWVISRSLAPIERARRQLANRAADDFSPLSNDGLPQEVRPLVDELNLLFDRVQEAFDAQKNFVADAAHELRSPLTALKLQAQALRNHKGDSAAREDGVTRLNQGIDRSIRLLEQLLLLAREEASTDQRPALDPPVDLHEVIKLAVTDLLPQARQKQTDMGLSPLADSGDIKVPGQPEALRTLLRNLLDNAIKYSPTGSQIDVSLSLRNGRPLLTVEDSGPGIAEADRGRVFDRFYRAKKTHAEVGSGLGMAIVQVIAKRHGATLWLGRSEQLGGLKVELQFDVLVRPRP